MKHTEPLTLRPYQQEAVEQTLEEINNPFGSDEIILEATTSWGKSIYISELCQKLSGSIVILVTFTPLIRQIAEHLDALGIDFSILKAGMEDKFDENHKVQLAMSQTLYARLDKVSISADYVIVDEFHVSYKTKRYNAIMDKLQPKKVIACTATPYNAVGVKLSNTAEIIRTTSGSKLTKQGFLTPLKYYVPAWSEKIDYSKVKMSGNDYTASGLDEIINTSKHTGLILESMNQMDAKLKKTLVFCSTIEHCKSVATALKNNGYLAEEFHSKIDKKDNESIMNAFRHNTKSFLSTKDKARNNDLGSSLLDDGSKHIKPRAVKCLVSVSKLSIGFSVSDIELGVMLRKSTVRSMIHQQYGRIKRLAPGKTHGEILDLAQCVSSFGFSDEEYNPPDAKPTPAENRKAVAEASSHLTMEHLESFIDSEEPQEVSREFYDIKIKEVRNKEQTKTTALKPMDLKTVFDTTDSIEKVIEIGAHIWHLRYGEAISKAGRGYKLSPSWLSEDAVKIMDDYPEKKRQWMKAHRTRIRNLLSGSSSEDRGLSTKLWNNNFAKNYNGIKFFSKYLLDNYLAEQGDNSRYKEFASKDDHDYASTHADDRRGTMIEISEEDIPF